MKKILLAIFGAALLMVGCTKELQTAVNDINSKLNALQEKVDANEKAIKALQAAKFIENVTPSDDGWTVTLSNGDVLYLYNGKDGADGKDGKDGENGDDGDAFFKSVVIDGDYVIFTLTDGTVITVPYAVQFAIEFISTDVALKASEVTALPYRIKGATEETRVYAIAGGDYSVKVDETAQTLYITAPAVLTENSVLVMADRGDGRVNTKQINVAKSTFDVVEAPGRVAYFWGDTFTLRTASNVTATISADVPWVTLKQTKALVEHEYTVSVSPTPSCKVRSGHIYVKDAIGTIIQDIPVTQDGCPVFFLNNQVSYSDWAAAATALATAAADGKNIMNDGTVQVIISQDAELGRIDIPANDAIKALKILPRGIGVPTADPSKVVVSAVTVPAGIPTTIENIVIRPANKEKVIGFNNCTDGENGNGTALLIKPGAVNLTVTNVVFDNSNETWRDQEPTVIYANGTGLTGKATFTGCTFTPGVQRFGQVWGTTEYVFDGCTFVNDISAYNLRIYDSVNLTIKNSTVDCVGDFVNIRTENNVVSPAVADGKTVDDTNTYSDRVVNVYTGVKGNVIPAAKGGSGIVKLNGIAYPTVTAALSKAPNGAVIEIGEGEIDDNVKIPAGKNYTIKAAAGAARDKVILNGNIEIAGSATIQGITVQTKTNVTDNSVTVSPDGDGYAWGHAYLIRVENGAKDVTVEDVRFIATEDNYGNGASGAETHFKDGLTQLFIAQSRNVKVLNCIFDSSTAGAYCNNQTYVSYDVEFRGNIFNVGGKKTYASRISGDSSVKFTGNEFNSKFGIDFYNFTGVLTLGDGKEDDNHYTAVVTNALNSATDKYDLLAAGAIINPVTVTFNAPTTAPAKDPEIELVWKHIDDTDWNATVDIANVRNIALNQDAMYLPCTAGHIYTLSLADGSLVKDQVLDDTEGHWPGLCGAATLSDGTVLLGTMALNTAKKFKVYTYDGTNLNVLVNMPGEDQYRLGDKITAAGTKDNMTIYAVDHKTGSANNGRYLTFKPGAEVLTAPTAIVPITGMGSNAGMAEIVPFADGKYYFELEGGKDDLIVTDGTDGASAKAITLGDLNADVNKRMTRGAKFFTAGGKNYMALIEMLGYNGANSFGATVRVYALPTNNPEVDLVGANAICTYDLPSPTASGNACGNLEVLKVGAKVYFGVGLKSAGVALLEFKY